MSDKAIDRAREVLKIIEDGGFQDVNHKWIDIRDEISKSVKNTKTYTLTELEAVSRNSIIKASSKINISVTDETTQIAANRLFNDGLSNLVLLNFASAFSPGGGFLSGAKAQEEDLARCSTIYQCLLTQKKYYEDNIRLDSMLFMDQIIYSPNVPWFRKRSRDKPSDIFYSSVISAPAPNANKASKLGVEMSTIKHAFKKRCEYVLTVAKENGHKNLILGAWGCGVFGHDPKFVAETFNFWLNTPVFKSSFENVLFAVYDPSKNKDTYNAFVDEFA